MYIVTGANGFIGSALIWELNEAGITEILCVDTVPPEERSALLEKRTYNQFIQTDKFFEFLEKTEALSDCQGVFHIGACSSTTEMNRDFLRENNTEYTQKLFELCTQYKVPFIYASSAATYGDGSNGFDDKKTSTSYTSLNPYGESKLNFDIWAEQQTEVPPRWYGLRYFNVFGPNEYHKKEMSSVIYKGFGQIKKTDRLKLFRSSTPDYEDGGQMRDFIYIKDITRWMRELFNRPEVDSGIYNMGFGKARTWLDLAKSAFSGLDKPLDIDWIDMPEKLKGQYQNFTEADMSKWLSQNLSKPQWPLENAVDDYYRNYLSTKDCYL